MSDRTPTPLLGQGDTAVDRRMGRAAPRLRRLADAALRANPGRIKRDMKGHNPEGNRPSRELRRSW